MTTPTLGRLLAIQAELDQLDGYGSRRFDPGAKTIIDRAREQVAQAIAAEPAAAPRSDPDYPEAVCDLDLGRDPNPPQVLRLGVTGCAGADRLVVVVDLGMGSPNGPAGDGVPQAVHAAALELLGYYQAETGYTFALSWDRPPPDEPTIDPRFDDGAPDAGGWAGPPGS